VAHTDDVRPAGQLILVPLSTLTAEQLASTVEIYREAFPARLRAPFTDLTGPAGTGRTGLALLDRERPVGFLALLVLGSTDWVLLRYFATAADQRGRGLGRQMWGLMNRHLAARGPHRVVLEVEDPAGAGPGSAERNVRDSRIRFYRCCGAIPVPAKGYSMPALDGSNAAPEPMLLMAAETTPGSGLDLSADAAAMLLEAVYRERYGLHRGHPLVTRALALTGDAR